MARTPPKSLVPKDWKRLKIHWKSFTPGVSDAAAFPVVLGTPGAAWVYGAGSDPITTDHPITLRIRAKAVKGAIGFCLVSEDYGRLVSAEPCITPEQGVATVDLQLLPQNAPARIVVRNQGDDGVAGEVVIGGVICY